MAESERKKAQNKKNLKPIKKGELSNEEAKRRGSLGGRRSVEARREKKLLRELAQMILEEEVTTTDGRLISQGEAALRVQARKAIQDGDTKALAFLRDTAGQAPVSQLDISGTLATEQARFNELLEQFNESG